MEQINYKKQQYDRVHAILLEAEQQTRETRQALEALREKIDTLTMDEAANYAFEKRRLEDLVEVQKMIVVRLQQQHDELRSQAEAERQRMDAAEARRRHLNDVEARNDWNGV